MNGLLSCANKSLHEVLVKTTEIKWIRGPQNIMRCRIEHMGAMSPFNAVTSFRVNGVEIFSSSTTRSNEPAHQNNGLHSVHIPKPSENCSPSSKNGKPFTDPAVLIIPPPSASPSIARLGDFYEDELITPLQVVPPPHWHQRPGVSELFQRLGGVKVESPRNNATL